MTKLTIQQQILSWLGMYRDNLPIEAVHKLQDLLELQPQEECNHVSDGMVYTSNPPKYKCKKCGYMTTEYMAQEEKTEETIEEKMVNISKRIWNNKHEQSILQKLRAELERIIKGCEECDGEPAEYHSLVKLRSLLNELETQPEEPAQEWKPREADIIEVSNDGVVWQERVFSYMGTKKNYFWCMYNKHLDKKIGMYEVYPEGYPKYRLWTYARPTPEELKLEKLPELNLKWDTEYQRDSAMIDQFNLLTTTVNLLIDKLNNK